MLPEGHDRELEDLALALVEKASALASQLHPRVREEIGSLVRSMNCYYSNLIEGHNTHPADINRALAQDFSRDLHKRNLQLEAKAHIEVQHLVDQGQGPALVLSTDYLLWLHQEFCQRLPEDLLWLENDQTGERKLLRPGVLRDGGVIIGRHIPPNASSLGRFLKRLIEAYRPSHLSKLQQIIAVAASHHRLLWIHPFYDGNGRVTRLFSHAYLRHLGIGNSLWSVSRGLARSKDRYKTLLINADGPRWNDLDGRGRLSRKALREFCMFFLQTCLDQVAYMGSLLEISELLRRMEQDILAQEQRSVLPKRSFFILREVLLQGEIERGKAEGITGYKDRQARTVLNTLIQKGYLSSDTAKGAVHLTFPLKAVEAWFPRLYPADISLS